MQLKATPVWTVTHFNSSSFLMVKTQFNSNTNVT